MYSTGLYAYKTLGERWAYGAMKSIPLWEDEGRLRAAEQYSSVVKTHRGGWVATFLALLSAYSGGLRYRRGCRHTFV